MNETKHQYFCTECGTKRAGLLDHPAIGIGGYSWSCPRCNGAINSREVFVSDKARELLERAVEAWDSEDEPYFERTHHIFNEIRAYLAEEENKSDPYSIALQSRCRGDKG